MRIRKTFNENGIKIKVSYDPLQEPLSLPKSLMDDFLKSKDYGDLLALYTFYYYTAKWQHTHQPRATTAYTAKGITKLLLEQGKNILIDATNLNFHTRDQWYQIAKSYEANIRIIWLKTSLKECKERNLKSPEGEKLPEGVLDRMASIFENPTEDVLIKEAYNIKIVEISKKGCKKGRISGNIYIDEMVKEANVTWKIK